MSNLPIRYDAEFAFWQHARLGTWIAAPVIDAPIAEDTWDTVDSLMGRPMYFDKTGNPITMRQWGELRELGLDPDGKYGEGSYQRVAQDTVGKAWVSTVWLGIDHGMHFGDEPYRPVIFETMVFGGKYDDSQMRYCTEWEAIKGHAEAVEDLRAGLRPWRSEP